MKFSYLIIIHLIVVCVVLTGCEKEPIKDEPNKPSEELTKPSTSTVEPTNPEPAKVVPTAYFPFDGTLEDVSGNDYYGYGIPEPSFAEGLTSGRQALSFTKTGKQAFVIGDGIIDTRSMTVSFWIKNVSEGDIFHLTSANVDYGNKMMSLTYTDGHLKYVVKRSNNHMSSYFNSTGNFVHKTIDDGSCHHIVLVADYNTLTYGASTTSLYVDGKLMDTVTETINPFDEKESSHCHYGSGTKFVLGGDNVPTMQVSCLRMYDSIQLDDRQIREIYDKEIKGEIDKVDNIKGPGNSVNIKSGLSAYFPFDGTLDDVSGNDYYGYGAPEPSFTEGLASGRQALSFTKTGKEAFVIGDGIIDTRSMTVSFWIKNISEGDIFHLTSANVDYGDKMMSLTYTDGHLKYVIKRSNNHMSSYFSSTGNFMHKAIDDGSWHHIALVADYNTLIYGEATTSLYVDGRIMDTVTETINPFDEKESSHCHYGSGTKFVLGGENVPTMQIAYLRMYSSRQLNADEMKTLYNDKI